MDDVYFVQQRTFQAWNIRDAEFGIRDIKNDLLFLPAWTGCDSTSAIFGKGHYRKIIAQVKSVATYFRSIYERR